VAAESATSALAWVAIPVEVDVEVEPEDETVVLAAETAAEPLLAPLQAASANVTAQSAARLRLVLCMRVSRFG